ncbi:hypothetical protein J6590_063592 [Homalodisca vitripennis]|nr:hypothetical protein J6590_063592 [Homalodisca vitripennis]
MPFGDHKHPDQIYREEVKLDVPDYRHPSAKRNQPSLQRHAEISDIAKRNSSCTNIFNSTTDSLKRTLMHVF